MNSLRSIKRFNSLLATRSLRGACFLRKRHCQFLMLVYAKLPNSRSRRSLIDFVGRHVDPIKSPQKVTVTFFFAPHALAQERHIGTLLNFSCPFVLPPLSHPRNLTQIVPHVHFLFNSLETEAIKGPMRTGIHPVLKIIKT